MVESTPFGRSETKITLFKTLDKDLDRIIESLISYCPKISLRLATMAALSFSGLSFTRIAKEFGISPNTVKTYMERVYNYTNKDREELKRLILTMSDLVLE